MRLEGALMSYTVRKVNCEVLKLRSEIASPRMCRWLSGVINNKTSGLKEAAIIFLLASRDSVSASPLMSISDPNADSDSITTVLGSLSWCKNLPREAAIFLHNAAFAHHGGFICSMTPW